jgi:MurNAc alpha-1-phosphate uridylyltransferase
MSGPKTAMVLAAGLGTRMRPLTNDRPKALVEVAGRPLVDHVLDRLAASGVERAVVNVHAFADLLEAHLKTRSGAPRIVISDERPQALETGGGLRHALPLLGSDPVWVANIDTVWLEDGVRALDAVAGAWDPAKMDACLLLAPTRTSIGFHDSGDFFLEPDGRLRFKAEGEVGPYVYVGAHITRTGIVADGPDGPFSLTPIWRRLAAEGRLYGVSPPGLWMHVGDPTARDRAQARLAEEAAAT